MTGPRFCLHQHNFESVHSGSMSWTKFKILNDVTKVGINQATAMVILDHVRPYVRTSFTTAAGWTTCETTSVYAGRGLDVVCLSLLTQI
mmetsp:Transcript_4240/g.9403  ORF Transcript_4240/g.9403 Transcript_4240/m.9403 type:complete len:89 (+) Transcript_4240:2840-3106(+)